MSDEIKAIPTVYKGVQLKSRMEAQCAVLFDKLGWEWEYEKYSLMLPSGTSFIPDFWFPKLQMMVECRGYTTERGVRQVNELAECIVKDGYFPITAIDCASQFITLGPDGVCVASEKSCIRSLVLYLDSELWRWRTDPPPWRASAAFAVNVKEGKISINGRLLDDAADFHEFCDGAKPRRDDAEAQIKNNLTSVFAGFFAGNHRSEK